MRKLLLFVLCLFTFKVQHTYAQQLRTINGIVTDASTGDPVPFANVAVKGTLSGATTDFDGKFKILFTPPADSLAITYIGYLNKSKAITQNKVEQTIEIQLTPSVFQLQEVKIYAGENPAYPILRKVVAQRPKNNPENVPAYEYSSYTKIQIDIDNFSDKFRKRKSVQKITDLVEKFDEVKGEDGQTIVPIFISESISDVYFRSNPKKKKEIVQKTKIAGVGLTDGSLTSQVIGSSFQQYNFYNNWLNLLEKDFISPIADSWKVYYEYYLADSAYNGTNYDYQIDFEPRQKQDLAFSGSFWVDGISYAITQIDANVDKTANLNFIEKIKIQQSYELLDDEINWGPSKTRVLIDVAELTDQSAGMLLKFYSANQDYKITVPKDKKFYDSAIELSEDYRQPSNEYWNQVRPEPLTKTEKLSFDLIDSLKVLPVIRTYTEILNIAVNGYKKIDDWNVDVGPYLFLYANNNIEGHRIRLGFKTDPRFSRKWIVNGFGAYGTKDKVFKYGGGVEYIVSRKPWTVWGISYSNDLERLGINTENIGTNSLFGAFSRFGTYQRGYMQKDVTTYFKREISKGLTQQVNFRHRSFDPLFDFAYRTNPTLGSDSPLRNRYEVTELNVETRWAKNEMFLQNDNDRISIGNGNAPIITFRYTLGINNFLKGDFDYHKFSLNVKQSVRAGIWGRTYYQLTLGYIPSTIPYPLLYTPLGNQSLFYVENAFNLMNYFEFISDRYMVLRVEHNFEGFILNRIPAIRKLKWRLLATGRVFYGGVSNKNLSLIQDTNAQGAPVQAFQVMNNVPYVEVGYGIDNIFKFGRLDAIHRLTYRNAPNVTPFAVKFSFGFNL